MSLVFDCISTHLRSVPSHPPYPCQTKPLLEFICRLTSENYVSNYSLRKSVMSFCNGYLCHQSNIPGLFSLMICCFFWPCVRAGHLFFSRLVFWPAFILFVTKDCCCFFFVFRFINKDCYCSCAHFPVFRVCSSLTCFKKNSSSLLEKRAETLYRS